MYRRVLHSKIVRLVHIVHLYVLYGSETSVDHFPVHYWLVFVTNTARLLCGTTRIFTYISGLFSFLKRPFHSSGGESLVFHRGGPDSMPGESVICGWQSGIGTGFSPSTWSFSLQYHSSSAPYSSLSICCTTRTNGWSLGTFQKSSALLKIGEHWIENKFAFLSSLKGLQGCW